MRAQHWICALGLFVASVSSHCATAQTPIPGSGPPPAGGQFSFIVCNKSGMDFYFAFIARRTAADPQYSVSGWWPAKTGDCQSLGSFAQGRFYYFAYNFDSSNARKTIEGTAVMVCLQYYDQFNHVIAGDSHCDPFPTKPPYPAGTYLQGFVELMIPETKSEYRCEVTSPDSGECRPVQ